MDDFIVTAYPYAKTAAKQLTLAFSHILKLLYPLLNNLYNANPTLISILLLISTAYIVLVVITRITNFIWSVTRNLFQLFFVLGILLTVINYYNKRAAGRVADDGTLVPGFDWDATWADFQGVWGFVQNIGGMLMDLLESGSNLEDGNAFNSGRRKTVGKKGDGMFADAGRRQGGAWQQQL
ncbi:hypothetical protein TWF696_008128 [Orbilia brochopaga]|uniref:Uncharacterized protein n=1 Tax=Orbilia brochopaga TaxID=3140254 RepID=A0AAV9URQ1_9PEZI